ncbi:MAG: hypothetical protein ACD_45C00622G0016 [uncultured bacterium]|nr:MAG: hypothetical protein ACD_45C00622G0016 [uncultured bacterium]
MFTKSALAIKTTASDEKTTLSVPNTHGTAELEELKQQQKKLQDIIKSFRDLAAKIQKNSPSPSLEELIAQQSTNVIKPATYSFWPKDINTKIEENLHAMLDSLAKEYKKIILLSDKLNDYQDQMKLCDNTIALASDLEKFIDQTIQLMNEEKETLENKQHTTQNLPLAILKFLITSVVPLHFKEILQLILDILPKQSDGNTTEDIDLQIQKKVQNALSNENNVLNKIVATLEVLYYRAENAFKASLSKQAVAKPTTLSIELPEQGNDSPTSMLSPASRTRLFGSKNSSSHSTSTNTDLSHSATWRCHIL